MKPQNLLILMSDEHNARMMGAAGHALVQTPNLDALAARGTRFTAAYTNCPICVPSRASFATGRYVHQSGYWDNAIAYDGKVPGWGHRLQAADVSVESIGKLHYRNEEDPTGFDAQHIPLHIKDGVGMVQGSIRGQFPDFTPRPGGGAPGIAQEAASGETAYIQYDRKIAERACTWLQEAGQRNDAKRGDGKPWVLFVSFVSPHYPLIVPEEYFDLYPIKDMPDAKLDPEDGFVAHPWSARLSKGTAGLSRDEKRRALAAYFGLCTFVDEQIGRVLNALGATGLGGDTRVLYTSDHGESAGSRGMWGKSVLYEEACQIPLILAGADVPNGKVSATPVSLVDAYPAIMDAAGLQAVDTDLPGRSLFEIAAAADDPGRPVFSEFHAMRSPSGAYMLRQGDYKFISYVGYEAELFDLANDPQETRNLAADPAFASVLADLDARLRAIVDPITTDARAKADQKALVERHGGPDAVMERAAGGKNFTEVPPEILAEL
jgi:choline-sulfatase